MKSPVSVNMAQMLCQQTDQLKVSPTALHDALLAINRTQIGSKRRLDFMKVFKSETY